MSTRCPSAAAALARVVSVSPGSFSSSNRVQRGSAGVHAGGKPRFGELLGFHFLGDLPGDDALEGHGGHLFQHGFLLQEVVKAAADVLFAHDLFASLCFSRSFARFRSGFEAGLVIGTYQ